MNKLNDNFEMSRNKISFLDQKTDENSLDSPRRITQAA
jgi:hypothetical protein